MNSEQNKEGNKDGISKKEPKKSDKKFFVQGFEKLGLQINDLYKKSLDNFSNLLQDFLGDLPLEPETLPVISYEEAISYFVVNRPLDPKVVKGAMLKYPHLKGYLFVQLFLDSENRPVCQPDDIPYGRQIIVEKIDCELEEFFGEQNLVIVE